MRRNPERRARLLDAAIELLAREGARGLSYRALDAEAGVPAGTSSNYFRNRDDLLHEVAVRVHERLQPAEAYVEETKVAEPTRRREAEVLKDLLGRVTAQRSGHLALLELRLEATRRPALRAALTETIAADLDANVRYHLESRFPGGRDDVVMMYLALTGMLLERLTLPDVVGDDEADRLVDTLVDRLFFHDHPERDLSADE